MRDALARLTGRGEGAAPAPSDGAARDLAASVLAIGRSPLFDAAWYSRVYPDVAADGTGPAWHYAAHGWREGRDPGPGFSTRAYLAEHPEAAAGPLNPLLHFETIGRQRGWTPPPSRAAAPPVVREEDLALLRETPLFDAAWYRAAYPDTAASDPAVHFLLQGYREKRNPGPDFRTGEYLLANPDVAESGVNPLLHYLRSGRAEGRPLRFLQIMRRVAGKGVCLPSGEAVHPEESARADEAGAKPPGRPPSRSLFVGFEPRAIEGMVRQRSVVDPGIDPQVAEHRDVWLLPRFHALYDADGARIDASLRDTFIAGPLSDVPLGVTKERLSRLSPDRIVLPGEHDTIEALHFYGGHCIPHYGHFLTNAMARFWALRRFDDLPVVFPATHPQAYRAPYARVVLKALGVLPRLVNVTRPTLFRRMVIPSPSLESGARIYRCFDAPHLAVTEQALARRGEPRFAGKKVYLSRIALGDAASRRVLQERQVEDWLTERGFVSVSPETLHLADQIDLFNSADTIVGMIGSAFHTAAFARPAHRSRLIALSWQRMNGRYLLIDELKGHTAFYVNCCRVETYTGKGRVGEVSLDVDTAIAGMELVLGGSAVS